MRRGETGGGVGATNVEGEEDENEWFEHWEVSRILSVLGGHTGWILW